MLRFDPSTRKFQSAAMMVLVESVSQNVLGWCPERRRQEEEVRAGGRGEERETQGRGGRKGRHRARGGRRHRETGSMGRKER